MESLKELFKVGSGPSSSHTIGPEKAAMLIKSKYPNNSYRVTLFGSLALTGKGHLTDCVIKKVLGDNTTIIFDYNREVEHPNTMVFDIYDVDKLIATHKFISVGGGSIEGDLVEKRERKDVYPHKTFHEIKKYITENNISLPEYVYRFEGEDIKEFLYSIFNVMGKTLKDGLSKDGLLSGNLHIKRKAKTIYEYKKDGENIEEKKRRHLIAYAYALSEENACGNTVVTAPTCGSSGVVPACLYYLKEEYYLSKEKIIDSLAVAGIIGNVVKENASISGACAGCQSEIGTACSMASAMIAYINNASIDEIETSAEIAMEHHLGLTCDPVSGLVQIPCIERNAVAALRAFDSYQIASYPIYPQKLSFDSVIKTMYITGKDINAKYRETSEGGLAKSELRKN
ncbi:MAG: L-serine ammonia-lyase, iron-sulfur-dependent, subunit alpha [Gammaproteobacteria bacterium]|nr:L-serine ammonia-lyase, iron-sulfur-dependent, subunit alpha [Gammaproteobacteria bacterium]